MALQATYDDANLILRLYELRREEKLRQAREWFTGKFHAATIEEVQALAPPGSQENAYMRMVTSYWEMAAAFVTGGVLNQELFFETNGELLFVWERIKGIVPAYRAAMKNPRMFRNIETVATAQIKHIEAGAPEAYAAFAAMVQGAGRT
jgi:hypothetical protein